MAAVTQLGYLGIGVRDLEQWRVYAETTLGLEAVAQERDGTLLLRMDRHQYRFALHEDAHDDAARGGMVEVVRERRRQWIAHDFAWRRPGRQGAGHLRGERREGQGVGARRRHAQ